jgi:PAS domain S-box-containing protein
MKESPEKIAITLCLGLTWLISVFLTILSSNQSKLGDLLPSQGIAIASIFSIILTMAIYFLNLRIFAKLSQTNHLKQQWRFLLDQSADLTYIINDEGKILEIAESSENSLGYQPEELINQTIFDFVKPEDLDQIKKTLQELINQDNSTIKLEFKIQHQDGNWRKFECLVSNFLSEPENPRIIITGKELTSTENLQINNQQLSRKLTESEQRYQVLTDNLPILIWLCDPEQNYTLFNLAWRDFMAGIIDQTSDPNWRSRIHPEDQETCLKNYHLAWENRETFTQKYRLQRIDGQYRWLLEKAVPLFTSKQDFIGYLGTCLDITESQNLEEKLNHNLTRYQQAIQNSDTFIFSQNVNLQYSLLENFIDSNQNNLGKSDFDLWPQEEAKQLVEIKDQVIKTESGIQQELLFFKPDQPQYFYFNIQPIKNNQGAVIGVTGLSHNITRYRLQELALQEEIVHKQSEIKQLTQQLDFQTNISQNLPAFIYLYDTLTQEFIDLRYPPYLANHPGNNADNDLTSILHPEDRENFLNLAARLEKLALEKPLHLEYRLKDKAGDYHDFQGWEIFLKNTSNILGIGIKIETKPEPIKPIQEAIKPEISPISNLLMSQIAAQLTKPLTAILISVQILTDRSNQWLNEKLIRNLNRIEHSVYLSLHILESLTLFEQHSQGELTLETQTFDLINFCQEIIGKVQQETDYQGMIELISNDQTLMINLDQKLFKHILINLLLNAVEYSPENGKISLGIFPLENEIILAVRDHGLGISVKDIGQIFNPFYRGSNSDSIPGIGLGLTVVKQLVKLMGGKMILETNVGFGTTLTLQIPTSNQIY